MKTAERRDIHRTLLFGSILMFVLFLGLIVMRELTDTQKVGAYIGLLSMFLTGLSSYMTIAIRNKKLKAN